MKKHLLAIVTIIFVFAIGCSFQGTNTSAPTPTGTTAPTNTTKPSSTPAENPTLTEAPTDVPTETPTEAPTNTPTATPTNTATPVPTSTPTPTATPVSAETIKKQAEEYAATIKSDTSIVDRTYNGKIYLTEKGKETVRNKLNELGYTMEYKGRQFPTVEGMKFIDGLKCDEYESIFYYYTNMTEAEFDKIGNETDIKNYVVSLIPKELQINLMAEGHKPVTLKTDTDHKHDFKQGSYCSKYSETRANGTKFYYVANTGGTLVKITSNFSPADSSTWDVVGHFPPDLAYDTFENKWSEYDVDELSFIQSLPAGEYAVVKTSTREDTVWGWAFNKYVTIEFESNKVERPYTQCEYLTVLP